MEHSQESQHAGHIMNGDANKAPMMLPQILDFAAAEDFLESMQQRVQDEQLLRIDASAVETLTLPCLQVMLAARSCPGGILVENPSAAFSAAFEDLGIDWQQFQDTVQDTVQERDREQDQNRVEDAPPLATADGGPQDIADRADLQKISESVMSKRILTIDDSKTMRDMLMLTLAEAGFDVLQAVDGQDGLDVLVNEQVDVVITDINMPRMDGYEVIRQLRSNPSHKTTPILVLTTESELDKRNLAREAGATGWMVKPFDPDRLVETVRKVAS
jgi:two-component system, chemotaxis family, chemotaxis protein CheY